MSHDRSRVVTQVRSTLLLVLLAHRLSPLARPAASFQLLSSFPSLLGPPLIHKTVVRLYSMSINASTKLLQLPVLSNIRTTTAPAKTCFYLIRMHHSVCLPLPLSLSLSHTLMTILALIVSCNTHLWLEWKHNAFFLAFFDAQMHERTRCGWPKRTILQLNSVQLVGR